MILVTGANGRLGRRIVQHLIARRPLRDAPALAVSVRQPALAADLAARGVDVRAGDFDQPETLATTFAGVRTLVLVSTDGPSAQRIAQHAAAISAARRAGVQRVLYTSFLDVGTDSPAEFARVHRHTEDALAASGLDATILRNPLYADDLPALVVPGPDGDAFCLAAGNGAVSLVSRDDLARALAAAALAPRLDKRVYELTGSEAVAYAELAARIARVSGRPLRYLPVTVTEQAAALRAAGLPDGLAEGVASLFAAVAEGRLARVTHDFAALVGHPPRSLDCLIREYFAPVTAPRTAS